MANKPVLMIKLCSLALLSLGCAQAVYAQTLRGTVLSESGVPLKNALVYIQDKPMQFAKTDSKGVFALEGEAWDKLYVSAFQHADKVVSVQMPATAITLARDPLITGNVVYHNNFNYLRPGPNYGKYDAVADFNTYKSKGLVTPEGVDNNASIDPTQSFDGKGSSMSVLFNKVKIISDLSHVKISISLSNNAKENNFVADELYFSYWVKFGNGFEFNCGGKLPGIAGSTIGNDDEQRWSGRIMWRYGGSLQFYMHYADKGNVDADDEKQVTMLDWGKQVAPAAPAPCADEIWTSSFKTEKWHHVEMHYKLNTPGKADGIMEGWLDGDAAYFVKRDVADFRLKGLSENATMNSIFFSTFYGGSKEWFKPTQDVYAWFDEFTVSRSRIGYNGTGSGNNGSTATATPKPVVTATATPKPVVTATPIPVATATPKPVVTATPTPSLACQRVAWNTQTEIDLSKAACVSFGRELQGSTVQFWDSDLNTSCDFRGSAASVDGVGSVQISTNYAASNLLTGSSIKFTASNQCKYVKVRAY